MPPINVTPPQQTSLADMMNIARGAQAYQQSQQLNPLQLQQQRELTEQARLSTEKAKRTLEPEVSRTESLADQAHIETMVKKFGLNKDETNEFNAILGGYANDKRLKPENLKNDPTGAVDVMNEIHEAAINKGIRKDRVNIISAPAISLAAKNPLALSQYIENMKQAGLSASGQVDLTKPSIGTNASGQTVAQNAVTGKMDVIGSSQVNPTTPGVTNFGEYQKDLTNRVAAGTQIDMRLNEAEDLMSKVKTGAGTRAFADVAQKLQAIGAPQALVDKAAGGDLSAVQSLNKFIAQSVTSSIGQMSGNPTANMMNDYLKNNPDVNSDPRALQRFIDFAHKQNEMAYEEQRYLTDKVKNKALNPDTHPAEAQQYIIDKFVKPKEQMQNQVKNQLKGQAEASKGHGKVTKTGTFNGKPVVQYEDGFVEYK